MPEKIIITVLGCNDRLRNQFVSSLCNTEITTNAACIQTYPTTFDNIKISIHNVGSKAAQVSGSYTTKSNVIITDNENQKNDGIHTVLVNFSTADSAQTLSKIVTHQRREAFIGAYQAALQQRGVFKNPWSRGWTIADNFQDILQYAAHQPNSRTAEVVRSLFPNVTLPEKETHGCCKAAF